MSSKLPKDVVLTPTITEDQSVKIIGLGGVGGIAARYACMFLASLGKNVRTVLIDGDEFEPKNTNRMFFSGYGNKAEVTRDDLLDRFKDTSLALIAVPNYIVPDNKDKLIRDGDIIICCVDNHATRKLIQDHCSTLNNIVLISGGNDGVGPDSTGAVSRGTYGNVQIYVRKDGEDITPTLGKWHPEIAKPADKRPDEKSCTDLVASTPQILFANLATASHILNALWLYLCGQLHYAEACFDIGDSIARPLPFPGPANAPKKEKVQAEADTEVAAV
jgi:molybdopterin/thiamine biosynthesis adenylyltransferase